MDQPLPSAQDHCRIQILVHSLGQLDQLFFNRIIHRLSRLETIEVSENPKRSILVKFVTNITQDHVKFSEFQFHRKIFGLVCIGQSTSSNTYLPKTGGEHDHSQTLSGNSDAAEVSRSTHSSTNANSLDTIKEQYSAKKAEFKSMLVDNRCVLFGFPDPKSSFESSELLSFTHLDDSNELEMGVRELIRSIYYILESKRLDLSFEKMDTPPCPLLPEEEKYRMGTENMKSKLYRRKCIGRLRKQVADHALLTGLPTLAMDAYHSAVEYLELASDFLWLAAALEGWSCSAMIVKYKSRLGEGGTDKRRVSGVATTSDLQDLASQHQTGVSIGHQRYRSDEGYFPCSIASTSNYQSLPTSDAAAQDDNSVAKKQSWENNNLQPPGNTSKFLNVPHSSTASLVSSTSFGPETRSSSASNLRSTSLSSTSSFANGDVVGKSASLVHHSEIMDRFKMALENYGKYSFASHIEYECVIRAVHVFIYHRLYIEAESFVRDRMGKFLDDKFVVFDNIMKAQICLSCASVYNSIGFRRKHAFFLRLSVLFRLNVADDETRTGAKDYQLIYPILYKSLRGYGIGVNDEFNETSSSSLKTHAIALNTEPANIPFALQVKAVYEVFMSAFRAEFFDAAIRHLCFILQNYYDNLDKGVALNMIEELNKMVSLRRDKVHCLAQPIVLDHYEIMLPPLQFTRFPTLSNCKVTALPAHLAPNVIDPADLASKIFIYSPFQDRDKERGVYWVVDCACEVSICVRNPLPIELEVRNLALITEGCKFDAMPVRLNLPSCYGSVLDPASTSTIKLLGVPRSSGLLKLTGYSCEVLGVKNVCAFRDQHQSTPNQSHLSSLSGQPGIFKVEVLQPLPLLQLETSLQRSPTVEDSIEAIAEATVFSGQTFDHSIFLFNSSKRISIKRVTIKINQPEVCGGPKLLRLLDFPDINELNESARRTFQPEVYDIKPLERREIRIRIFGIDPSATAAAFGQHGQHVGGGGHKPFHPPPPTAQPSITSMGEEHRVYVRRATSMSLNEGSVCSLDTIPQSKTEAQQSRSNSPKRLAGIPILSAPALLMAGTGDHGSRKESSVGLLEEEDPAAGHDLIPYTGRLLSADFVFTYTADATGPNGEQYERVAKLPLAIAIVPAVNVSDWHILSGDSPTSRYVVVDVCNLTDMDAELTYGDNRMIWVQPKEICRVPLLCPCCTDIQSSAFASAAQLASHMMQMREIEGLRRTLERHVSRHLDIRWTIPALKLEGSVPVGSLLSSVSFLKQLVIPAMSLSIRVNNAPYVSEDDVAVGIGELVSLQILLLVSLKCKKALNGQLSLRCFQDLQNGLPIIDRSEHLVVCGPSRIPFSIQPTSITTQQPCSDKPEQMGRWETAFNLVFRYEGVHKIRPEITGLGGSTLNLSDEDDIFLPTVSFNVITKVL